MIEKRTKDQVEVIVYPAPSLGSSSEITEQLSMGTVEFAMASPGSLGKFIPEMQVFLLHFVLPQSDQEIREVLNDTECLDFFDSLYTPKGLKLLSMFSEGSMVWTTNKEIRSLQDFAGVKMRVMTSPVFLAAYRAYGASPTPMPYSEVYSGLQLNMIDGQVNPVFAIERQKYHEVTSWLIFPGHTSFVTSCAANRRFFQGLSAERRQMVSEAIAELDRSIFQVQAELEAEKLKVILRDKKRQRAEYNVCGDLADFVASLSGEERREIIEDNEFVTMHPPLSAEEVAEFEQASDRARQVFLHITGPRGAEALELLSNKARVLRRFVGGFRPLRCSGGASLASNSKEYSAERE